MLILGRRRNEGIRIGDDIEVIITEISGDSVRIGIRAPKQISIQRTELIERIRQSNQQAAQAKDIPKKAIEQLAQKITKRDA